MKTFFTKFSTWFLLICSIFIVIYVLFIPPRPGVADQGDFQRVMDVTGLNEKQISNSDLAFFRYVKPEYIMSPINPLRFFGIIPTTSMIYPIAAVKALCKICGFKFFNTEILAILYAVIYITALLLCLKWHSRQKNTQTIIILFSLFVLLDGNYLVWFNSLYGEPMMIIGLLLFIASILNVSNKIESINNKDIIFVLISSFLFLGSKAQCIPCLPFIILMIVRIFFLKNKNAIGKVKPKNIYAYINLLPIVILIFYAMGFYWQINKTCGVDTKYNSVFYGILKNSDNPAKDLEMLGLCNDMAVDSGKHAYLAKNEYTKYVPWSDITEKEFNQKISNFKIIKFYLLNPKRLVKGMQYTASQSFITSTLLGKYQKKDIEEYTHLFNRFTIWSDIRNSFFPKKLWFILSFYIFIFTVSFIIYYRTQTISTKLRIELLWVIIAIGIFQFPLPYIGNGEADTAKQLFLFNYTFDILVINTVVFVAQGIIKRFMYRRKQHNFP